jgi:hypothetical protein
MDWLTFIASMTGSLAWPAAALIGLLTFRRALVRLLPDLNRLKYKDLELEFGKAVAQARVEIEAGPVPNQLPPAPPLQKQPYLQSLAEVSPRAALLEAWLPFEIAASRIGDALAISGPSRPAQMPRLIDGLVREGILTEPEARAVARLRGIRNKVVHAVDVDLSPDEVSEYARLLQEVTEAMERRFQARA